MNKRPYRGAPAAPRELVLNKALKRAALERELTLMFSETGALRVVRRSPSPRPRAPGAAA